ncbi:MAG TPA: glycosyltransferase [Candidatus Acidoferrum sp.]|jgi:glycosyltransferase involved in cell wall biosynthesis|nr:glycosyltransferase [Candidatus Acidoferrum sp.]
MALKILHILSGLGQGGIEKWLVNLTAELHRRHGTEVECGFLTLLEPDGYYRAKLESMDCKVSHCQLAWRHLPSFIHRLSTRLRPGRYDVVHCHADYLSGLVLPVARAVGVRTRIAHVHTTQFAFQARKPLARYLVGRLLRRLSASQASSCVGCSQAALDSYLGELQRKVPHVICACGIPFAGYREAVSLGRGEIRQSLNWPEGTGVVLHVGRHSKAKNLFYLLGIFAGMVRHNPDLLCVLAGAGPLTNELLGRASELGISEKVRFLGIREDVPRLMRAADLLLFPSLYEGLGLVLIEAQAVGLRSLVSNIVPSEVQLVEGLVHRLPLSRPPEAWTEAALQLLKRPLPDAKACLGNVESSPFNIRHSAESLMALYSRTK